MIERLFPDQALEILSDQKMEVQQVCYFQQTEEKAKEEDLKLQ